MNRARPGDNTGSSVPLDLINRYRHSGVLCRGQIAVERRL
jgi:hypothetical protein